MMLSHAERDDLIARVGRKLARRRVPHAVIADAVDRVAGALLSARERPTVTGGPKAIVAICADSMPDLASRLRRALASGATSMGELGSATEGRHTVVTLEVEDGQLEALRSAAAQLGARAVSHGGIA